MDTPVPDSVLDALGRLDLDLDRDRLAGLAAFHRLFVDANARTNLTAVREPEAVWHRMIVDALTVLPVIGDAATLVDVGTGGGLPGIPLAIARPDLAVTLVEATGKKCEALTRFVEGLGLDRVSVVNGRAETVARDPALRERFDVATSRALGALPVVLELTLPFIAIGGEAIAMKGPAVAAELDGAASALQRLGGGRPEVRRSYPDDFENDLVLVRIPKRRATPRAFPRAPGLPKKQPL